MTNSAEDKQPPEGIESDNEAGGSSKQNAQPIKTVRADQVASYFALALSIAALAVSLFEVASIRRQQATSVWPYLVVSQSYSPDGFSLYLENKGIGPALVSDINGSLGGETIADVDKAFADLLGDDAFGYEVYRLTGSASLVISSGERVEMFGFGWEERTRRLIKIWGDGPKMSACYCSVYGAWWTADNSAKSTTAGESCKGREAFGTVNS